MKIVAFISLWVVAAIICGAEILSKTANYQSAIMWYIGLLIATVLVVRAILRSL